MKIRTGVTEKDPASATGGRQTARETSVQAIALDSIGGGVDFMARL